MTFLDFYTLLANMIAAAQASSSSVLDTTVGSLTRAIFQATIGVVMWLQAQIALLLQSIRAATATGAALDSWMADYGVTRIGAISAVDSLTFARFSAGATATIPVGTLAQTADGTVQFAVTADPTNAAYSAVSNSYTLAAGISSVVLPAQAVVAGAAGNVAAGTVNTLGQAIPYVDTVVNASAATGGANAESDAALRARFITYIASLSRATLAAIKNAASNVSSTLTFSIVENTNPSGVAEPGYFYLVIDDGTGSPSSALISAVSTAVDAVRAFTVGFAILPPSVITATVATTIGINPSYSSSAVLSAVQSAVTSFINSIPVGGTLYYTQLANAIYQASSGVVTVKALTLNGGTLDITPTNLQVVRAGTVTAVAG